MAYKYCLLSHIIVRIRVLNDITINGFILKPDYKYNKQLLGTVDVCLAVSRVFQQPSGANWRDSSLSY